MQGVPPRGRPAKTRTRGASWLLFCPASAEHSQGDTMQEGHALHVCLHEHLAALLFEHVVFNR